MIRGIPEAVIFDFDGVVVNSEIIALKELKDCLADLGVDVRKEEMVSTFLGSSFEDIAEFVRARTGSVDVEALRNTWYSRLFHRYEQELSIMPGVRTLIAALKDRGIKFCIASGGSYRRLDFALSTTGLNELFVGHAFSADSVARGKPEPDVFFYAAEQMQVAPNQCLVVEDAIAGVIAACKANMQVVGFVGGDHLADCREEHAQRLLEVGACEIVNNLVDVAKRIETRH